MELLRTLRAEGLRSRRVALLAAVALAMLAAVPSTSAASEGSAPTVTRVNPYSGPGAGGTSVAISGTNLSGATAVKFGPNSAAGFKVESPTLIVATSPAFTGGNAFVDVTVTTPAGTSPTQTFGAPIGDLFFYGPTVTKVEPQVGPAAGGTAVTITGTGFESFCKIGACANTVNAVSFGSIEATDFTVNSEDSLTAIAPPGTGTVDVTVTTLPLGEGETSPITPIDRFTYWPAGPPTLLAEAASSVTQTAVRLNASVNPNGVEVSECTFEYGPTQAYGSSAPCSSSPGSGIGTVAVSAPLTGLTPAATYHFRISATNADGTSKGSDGAFHTPRVGALCGLGNAPAGQGTAEVCNWYSTKSMVPAGQPRVFFFYGGFGSTTSVAQTSAFGEVSCETVGYGTVENPSGGGGGEGEVVGAGFYSCVAPQCEQEAQAMAGKPGRATMTASNLPWKQALVEAGGPESVKDRIGVPFSGAFGTPLPGEMDVKVACEVIATKERLRTAEFEGALEPEIGIGTGPAPGLNVASELRFAGSSSGALESPGGQSTYTGLLKYAGWLPGTLEVW